MIVFNLCLIYFKCYKTKKKKNSSAIFKMDYQQGPTE